MPGRGGKGNIADAIFRLDGRNSGLSSAPKQLEGKAFNTTLF